MSEEGVTYDGNMKVYPVNTWFGMPILELKPDPKFQELLRKLERRPRERR